METLLAETADCWRRCGVPELADGVAGIEPAGPKQQVGMPENLLDHFARAFDGMTAFPGLRDQLRRTAHRLAWSDGDLDVPEAFRGRFASVELAGPHGMCPATDVSFGVLLQSPAMAYPSHWHAAVEHFLVLSGTAAWQRDDGPFEARRPGSVIYHAAYQPHAITTGDEPLLALWFWQGDLDPGSYSFGG